ncbi:MAG: hypothetical protein DRP08_06555 [Candidatus Aenigmatarchaeota archaeon]|nr:MAG: hypothetical protein DRP08_06555 [Candidatus Aenigmarchaeota archaeon]
MGEFVFNGHKLFIVVNHFNSKGGDQPLFGRSQPPAFPSEVQRKQQAQVVNDFVDRILALDAHANVIVLGDLNDFQFSEAISDTLAADALINLMSTLPITEQYTYIYDGNSQALDQILVSDNLFEDALVGFDVVHTNAEFVPGVRPSDHDPVVATFFFGPLSVVKEVTPTVGVPLGGVVTYTIALANNGVGAATGVVMTDTLPPEVSFGGWVEQGSASLLLPGPSDGVIIWGPWPVSAGGSYTFHFTATVTTDTACYGADVTNSVYFTSDNANSGSAGATFTIRELNHIYLPLILRNSGG